jgi:WD40 repeat protein
LLAKAGPKAEPISLNLIASLRHPERKASVATVAFSPDGARLFTAGYPTGIVQVWDLASKKEVRRIDTPPGYRSSAQYALLTPDWKKLYVPVDKRSVKQFERDGKKRYRVEYAGKTRVWDVASGKEKDPLRPAKGSAPVYAKLAPDGRFLVCIEQYGYESGESEKVVSVVWDLETGKKRKLCDGFAVPSFSPDGRTVVVSLQDFEARTSTVKLLELATGKELARLDCPDTDRHFSVGPVSPDGAVVAVHLGGKKGAPTEVWFLDARTLDQRGKCVGKGDPEGYGWSAGVFTPDGKRFVTLDGAGSVLLWDVAGQRVERTLPAGGYPPRSRLAVSPDGKTLAIGWTPKVGEKERVREPEPEDLPQPRVSLIDLSGKTPSRVLVAPHGYLGGLTFSPDGKLLAFGGAGAVHLFDLTLGR